MIQVHVELAVDPAKEQEMLRYFQTVFRPAAMKFRGYLDVRMLKVLAVPVGTVPAGLNYRFAITYESEEMRQKWVAKMKSRQLEKDPEGSYADHAEIMLDEIEMSTYHS